MRAIMVMYDSLNRHCLPNYGCELTKMPNFKRLEEKTVTFDNSYVASLPCMPARRELHTGRLNFLHRGWSPLEPFDDSMPELLKQNGIYTHIVSDHQHYWEDGGATYHTRYQSWECIRGQEGDPWKGSLAPIDNPTSFGPAVLGKRTDARKLPFNPVNWRRQDQVNRTYIKKAEDFPQAKTMGCGLEFIETNKDYDNWFLQIETFDPHEPFFSPEEFQALYREENEEPFRYDWPPYGPAEEDAQFVGRVRKKYYSLLSMCDHYLGKVLDLMDKYDMWKDTMLIVNTDHGFLLGEHLWWSKACMPVYNELANTPLFIWNPRTGAKNVHRSGLVQTIDLAPTILDYFGLDIPKDMEGKVLTPVLESDTPVRKYGIYGFFGSHVNITDGEYVYMRAPARQDNTPLNEYTLMPTMMRNRMLPKQLKNMELAPPFSFTKDCQVLKIKNSGGESVKTDFRYGNMLFNVKEDPKQLNPIDDPAKEVELINEMIRLMKADDAPVEQFERLGLPYDAPMTVELLMQQRKAEHELRFPQFLSALGGDWEEPAVWALKALTSVCVGGGVSVSADSGPGVGSDGRPDVCADNRPAETLQKRLSRYLAEQGIVHVTKEDIFKFAKTVVPEDDYEGVLYTMKFVARLD